MMKMMTLFMFVCCMHISAKTLSQSVTLSGKDMPVKQIFAAIKEQTGYMVFYNRDVLEDATLVSLDVKDMPLKKFLELALKDQPFTYQIADKTISLSRKPVTVVISTMEYEQDPPVVSGIVRNAAGKPLDGVTVRVKGAAAGTSTSSSGTFSLGKLPETFTLQFSCVGYASLEILVRRSGEGYAANAVNTEQSRLFVADIDGGNIHLALSMPESASPLDEIQIMAYGSTTKRLNIGNVTTIKSEEIQKQPVNNPLLALQGRVPGLQILPSSGLPGDAVSLQIRGRNSLTSDASEPLIVVDGLPVVNNVAGMTNGTFLSRLSLLSFINPQDIESIDVLKDAEATSIYGSRGANGVILVTTKKGRAGKTKINLLAQNGWSKVPKKVKLLTTEEYLTLRHEAFSNRGMNWQTQPMTRQNADLLYWDQNRYTDWQKELIGGTGSFTDIQGSVSGGTQMISYTMGGNYHRENTVFPGNTADQKGSIHLSLAGTSANQRFKSAVNASYLTDYNTLPGVDLTEAAIFTPPNAPALYTADGELNYELFENGATSFTNPLAELYREYEGKVRNLIGSAEVSYEIIPSLVLKTQLGYNEMSGESFRMAFPFAGRAPDEMGIDASVSFHNSSVRNLSLEPQLQYRFGIAGGNIEVLAGASYQRTERESMSMYATGYKSDALLRYMGAATALYPDNNTTQYKYTAVFARLNYNLRDKYMINLSARRDGSSRFGPGNQFGNFGSVAAGWIFSEEQFMQAALPFLSFGKLRVSYGSSGNENVGDYAYLERYSVTDASDPYQGFRGYYTLGLFNTDYAWEVTRKAEIGLETGFFKDRILINASYYRNRSGNQLLNIPLPSMVGPGSHTANLPALIQSSGFEGVLNTVNVRTKAFTWSTSFNISLNRNKLLKYPDVENSPHYASILGKPFYGIDNAFKSAGVDPATGRYKFLLADGTESFNPIDPSRLDGGAYVRVNTLPAFYGGISNSFSYKGFSLDVLFQFSKQIIRDYYFQANMMGRAGRSAVNLPAIFTQRWRKPGDISPMQQTPYNPIGDFLNSNRWFESSDLAYTDGSFIRLKNFSLSYTIPDSWKRPLHMDYLRLFLQGQNLLTFTKYKGLDPETRSMTGLPVLRVITAGVQVTL